MKNSERLKLIDKSNKSPTEKALDRALIIMEEFARELISENKPCPFCSCSCKIRQSDSTQRKEPASHKTKHGEALTV